MTATAFYRLDRIAGGFRLSLSVHITKREALARLPYFYALNRNLMPGFEETSEAMPLMSKV